VSPFLGADLAVGIPLGPPGVGTGRW